MSSTPRAEPSVGLELLILRSRVRALDGGAPHASLFIVFFVTQDQSFGEVPRLLDKVPSKGPPPGVSINSILWLFLREPAPRGENSRGYKAPHAGGFNRPPSPHGAGASEPESEVSAEAEVASRGAGVSSSPGTPVRPGEGPPSRPHFHSVTPVKTLCPGTLTL